MYSFLKRCKKTRRKEWLDHVKFFTSGWFAALIFFYIMRSVGTTSILLKNLTFFKVVVFIPAFTFFSGIVFGSLHYFFEKYLFRKIPFWKLLIRLCVDQLFIISLH